MYEEQVQRGAKWLDSKMRNWEDGIDLDSLYIGACGMCVLGQVVSESYSVFKCLQGFLGNTFCLDNGFAIQQSDVHQLTVTWKSEILRRRKLKAMMQNIAEAVMA